MATSTNSIKYMVTKNTKFEAKLARYLISNPGDQLLGYDACIEKKESDINYRLIVLGLDSIYLADNPPKPFQLEKPYVYYRDILRAELINDYPDFLSENEKKNTLHIHLRVIMPSNKNKKDKIKKPKSISVDNMDTIPSLFDRFTLENINTYMDDMTPRSATSSRDVNQVTLPQLSAAIPLVLSSSSSPPTINEPESLMLPLYQLDLPTPRTYNSSTELPEYLDDLALNTTRSRFQRLFSSRRTFSDEQNSTARSKSARSLLKKKTSSDSNWTMETPRFNRYTLQKHHDSRYGVLHTPRCTSRSNPNDDMLLVTARSTLTDLSLISNTNINTTNEENSMVYCPSVEEVASFQDVIDEDIKDIDIYLLSLNSKIPQTLSSALNNYVVVSTSRYQSDQQLSTLSNDRLQHSMDVIIVKFTELKNEILQSYSNTSQLIKLTDELYNACDKYSKVKEFFWKDQELFVHYVKQFHSCSQAISNNEMDEHTINFSFSIMQLLTEVFLNTFASNERLMRLTHDHCSRLPLLVNSLLMPPITLLSTPTEPSDGSEQNEILKDTYSKILNWILASSALVWQIGDLLGRPSWTSKDFHLQHFIKLFEKQEHKDEYFDLFIDALSRLTMNKENRDPLSPKHTLYVYQLFSILSMLLINSTILYEYLRDRYLEEFKYFLKEDIILSRIPIQYPVYRFIPELIRSVHHHILYGEPNLNSSYRSKHYQLI